MKKLFIKSYIPQATILDINMGDGIYFYEANNSIFVLVNTSISGLITKELKVTIDLKLKHLLQPIVYVNMFNSKADYIKVTDAIIWGTYAWFADNPKHYIHFDDKPSADRLITRSALT
jgi:BsuBI/PstI restriction endonuclease domain